MINNINNTNNKNYEISTSIVPNTAFNENLLKNWKRIQE